MTAPFFQQSKYEKAGLDIDGRTYDVFLERQITEGADAPRLLVVSYLPDNKAIGLLRRCIETIQKFTDTPYELWVIDNNSPEENIAWLDDVPGINLVLSRTQPEGGGSYANAIGLEIGRRLIDPDTKYIMALHQDVVACKLGWLRYLLSKFDDRVRAVGVREDRNRVKEGILHVLGYLIDFQLFKKLELDFFPELPAFDVGDRAIVGLKQAGYRYFATPNSIWDRSVVDRLSPDSPFRDFGVDRSVADDGEVIFMHLGRGVYKSTGQFRSTDKSIAAWEGFVDRHLFPERAKVAALQRKLFSEFNYTLRRYFVDRFFFENIYRFRDQARVLDVGGKRANKRGAFNIEAYPLAVEYVNSDSATEPDYVCDAANIPVDSDSYDGVILAEVLEHVPDPKAVLAECQRVLRPGGTMLITVPFLFHVHADPVDYGRYTEYYWREAIAAAGLELASLTPQGGYYGVLANMLKLRLMRENPKRSFGSKIKNRLCRPLFVWFQKKALVRDERSWFSKTDLGRGHTTGYGLVCRKPNVGL
jgi:SAM-dependent methyltransferase